MNALIPNIASTVETAAIRRRYKDSILRWQSFTRFIMKPVMKVFARDISFNFNENELLANKTYIVVSNHQSQLDAFVLLAALSSTVFNRLKPFRAMTTNRFLVGGPIRFAALKMGCYPAKPHSTLRSGIEYSTALIRHRQTVYMCPEGKKSQPGKQTARSGVAVLAKLPDVEIIPVHIQWTRAGRWRRSFQLTFGKPFDASKLTAQEILDACYALPLH